MSGEGSDNLDVLRVRETDAVPEGIRGGAVSVGNFDGVHRGHAALMAKLARQAGQLGGPAVAVTFDPHPLQLLRPQAFQPLLTTPADRANLLRAAGADRVVILETSASLLGLAAAEFFERVIRGQLGARAVVEGMNFNFGRDRQGNVELLSRLCREAGLRMTTVPAVKIGDTAVSSSRVRNALLQGDIPQVLELLGRPYRIHGRVGTGQGRGQGLGFPTANLKDIETLVPGDGVYAVEVSGDNLRRPGAANVGSNPTFGENARKVEIHLIGFEGDLRGRLLAVDFRAWLRPTRKFPSADELVHQLRQDVEQAKVILQDNGSTAP